MKTEKLDITINDKDAAKIKSALEVGAYTLTPTGAGREAELAVFLSPTMPGSALVQGWSEAKLAQATAGLAFYMIEKGAKASDLGDMVAKLGLCNSSACNKAASGITIEVEGCSCKPSLELWWKKLGGGRTAAIASLASWLPTN